MPLYFDNMADYEKWRRRMLMARLEASGGGTPFVPFSTNYDTLNVSGADKLGEEVNNDGIWLSSPSDDIWIGDVGGPGPQRGGISMIVPTITANSYIHKATLQITNGLKLGGAVYEMVVKAEKSGTSTAPASGGNAPSDWTLTTAEARAPASGLGMEFDVTAVLQELYADTTITANGRINFHIEAQGNPGFNAVQISTTAGNPERFILDIEYEEAVETTYNPVDSTNGYDWCMGNLTGASGMSQPIFPMFIGRDFSDTEKYCAGSIPVNIPHGAVILSAELDVEYQFPAGTLSITMDAQKVDNPAKIPVTGADPRDWASTTTATDVQAVSGGTNVVFDCKTQIEELLNETAWGGDTRFNFRLIDATTTSGERIAPQHVFSVIDLTIKYRRPTRVERESLGYTSASLWSFMPFDDLDRTYPNQWRSRNQSNAETRVTFFDPEPAMAYFECPANTNYARIKQGHTELQLPEGVYLRPLFGTDESSVTYPGPIPAPTTHSYLLFSVFERNGTNKCRTIQDLESYIGFRLHAVEGEAGAESDYATARFRSNTVDQPASSDAPDTSAKVAAYLVDPLIVGETVALGMFFNTVDNKLHTLYGRGPDDLAMSAGTVMTVTTDSQGIDPSGITGYLLGTGEQYYGRILIEFLGTSQPSIAEIENACEWMRRQWLAGNKAIYPAWR